MNGSNRPFGLVVIAVWLPGIVRNQGLTHRDISGGIISQLVGELLVTFAKDVFHKFSHACEPTPIHVDASSISMLEADTVCPIGSKRAKHLVMSKQHNTETRNMSQTIKYTKQGVRDLNHLKGKSVGIRLAIPPQDNMMCEHPVEAIEYDHHSGISHCCRCKKMFDFDGKPIN